MTEVKGTVIRTMFCVLNALALTACERSETSVRFDSEMTEALDEVLRVAVDDGSVPGVVGLVTNRDEVVYRAAFGIMDAAGSEPMRTDAIFAIASMTKPITSLGVMILVEERRIELDDVASSYVPELADREVLVDVDAATETVSTRPAARPVTLRDLLRHTSGLGYEFSSHELLEWARVTARSYLQQPLLHDPGARWTYGSSTYFLGRVIEEVSGQDLSQFLQARIFGPLGMTDTSFELTEDRASRLAATYRRRDGSLQGRPPTQPYKPQIRGDYGLLSTADDYARFLRLIMQNGETAGIRIINADSVAAMAKDQLEGLTVSEQPGALPALSLAFPLGAGCDGFGLGFQIARESRPGARPAGSLSWAGLQNTHFWIDRKNGVGVVLLTQVLPFYDEAVIDVLTTFERTLYERLRGTP